MQENNRFLLRTNRFNCPEIVDKKFSCIQVKKNFKSINIPKEKFTNFASSMGSKKYKLVKDIYIKYLNKSNIIDMCFYADELIYEKSKIDRLKTIIEANIGREISKDEIIKKVWKFKNKEDVEIQFYFYYDGKVLNLLLIDLYHLGIIAQKNGRYIWENKYLNNKGNRCCLSNIVK